MRCTLFLQKAGMGNERGVACKLGKLKIRAVLVIVGTIGVFPDYYQSLLFIQKLSEDLNNYLSI